MQTLQEITDDELVGQLRAGDQGAFRELYERHHAAVEAYAWRLCRRADLVDDVVSEAFFKTLRAIANGRGPVDGFRPYVFTATRRTAVRMLRTDRDVAPWDEGVPEVGETDERWHEHLEQRESPVLAALRSLPERSQRAVWLLDVEGWSASAVAEDLGISPNAASALAYRSRQRLRVEVLRRTSPGEAVC